jgi:hypothetical protein
MNPAQPIMRIHMRPKLEAAIQQEELQNLWLLRLQPDREYQEMLTGLRYGGSARFERARTRAASCSQFVIFKQALSCR